MQNKKNNSSLSTIFLAILACMLWSTAFAGVKFGLRFVKPLSFAGVRFMIAGMIILPVCGRLKDVLAEIRSNLRTVLCVTFFQTLLLYILFYWGMSIIPGALGAIIIGSSPMFSAIMAHFLMQDDEMTLQKMMSILIGIGGVFLISISRRPWSYKGLRELLGVMLLIGGNTSSAFGNILVAKDKKKMDPLILNSVQIFLGGFLIFLISFVVEGPPHWSGPFSFYLVLLWLSILSAVSVSIWFTLLKRPGVKVSELNLWKFIIPVFGALLSWILLTDESPDTISILGMVSVALSILIYHIPWWSKDYRSSIKINF